ncbi:MAG: glycosyltransferase [Mojavia pulchra JT2-VF2]|jgi:glycosyltransferase involved in cell wall biosynthesis|uniref:Glycosyltransferase n=1 Tax=Mojavia pulchra JT2-VF2 TaxID=287848 RepID=A0A951UGP3_9NOST|nr:glycosyltransferase [Mojavia pulchra JT2-VF2]
MQLKTIEKPKFTVQGNVHLWFPNLFEFKGGIQVYLQDFLQALQDQLPNLSVSVLDKLDKNKPIDKFNADNLSFTFSGHLSSYLQTTHFAFNLIKKALLNRPKIIVCGHLNFAPVAFCLHQLTGIPYTIIVYGVDAWQIQDKWKIKALHSAEKIISISGYTRDRLIDEQQLPPNKIELLPVTFDVENFQLGAKPSYLLERYSLSSKQPVILTVTRLASTDGYKGYDQILHALPEIKRHLPDVHYILVGKGDDRSRIEQLIAQLNLQDCVTLTGFIPDSEIRDHYNLCDVFAMPSRGEGFGIVYLEALACGKPTLGGNQDGAIDALCHGELGALVNPSDVDAIAQTLIQILQGTYPNPLIYQPEALRQKVIDTFGFKKFKQTVAEIMQSFHI